MALRRETLREEDKLQAIQGSEFRSKDAEPCDKETALFIHSLIIPPLSDYTVIRFKFN